MERVLNVMTLELKKKGFFKNVAIGMTVAALIILSSFMANRSTDVASMTRGLISYLVLIYGSFLMAQEFSNKTDKMIFTGIFSRTEIIVSKMAGLVATTLLFFVACETVAFVSNAHMGVNMNAEMLLNDLHVFLLYAFNLGSFMMLVSSITCNAMSTGLITYVLHFDLILVLLSQALESGKSDMVKCIIRNLPFYMANTGFHVQKYSLSESMIMLASGCAYFALTCFIINRKNM